MTNNRTSKEEMHRTRDETDRNCISKGVYERQEDTRLRKEEDAQQQMQ